MLVFLAATASATALDPHAGVSLGTYDTAGVVSIDTGTGQLRENGVLLYTGVVEGGVLVFRFDSLRVDLDVTATGTRPLALLSRGDLTLAAVIHAEGVGAAPGPGGGAGATVGGDGSGPGAGRGDTDGGGGGGFGGAGGDSDTGANGGSTYGDLRTSLQGGSGGARSDYATNHAAHGNGGGGGGAVELGAGGRVLLSGSVLATGGDGITTATADGGGGGSGGGILVHASAVGSTCTGTLDASGGDGGDDGGAMFTEGGGGGGGRIHLQGVPNCPAMRTTGGQASGNSEPGSDGSRTSSDADLDADGVTVLGGDCDDRDPARTPGRAEVCDGLDQDCDGLADDGLAFATWYPDADADGHGVQPGVVACQQGARAAVGDDCADDDADRFPGNAERCDDLDQNCDNAADEGLPTLDWFRDSDGDGSGVLPAVPDCATALPGHVADALDCDDADGSRFPGATETCNGADDDCSGIADDGLPTSQWWADGDGDGFGEGPGLALCAPLPGGVAVGGDCDDADRERAPNLPETSCNTRDDDCARDTPDDADADADGVSLCAGDCDDLDAEVSPDHAEAPCNARDDDCDPVTRDEPDEDLDGLGACEGDCRDDLADVPGADEVDCNAIDDDCDPGTSDGEDRDSDGVAGCAGDCDDGDPERFPGNVEIPGDGVDQDCDGADEPLPGDTGEPGPPDTGTTPPATGDTGEPEVVGPRPPRFRAHGCAQPGVGTGLGGIAAALLLARRRR